MKKPQPYIEDPRYDYKALQEVIRQWVLSQNNNS